MKPSCVHLTLFGFDVGVGVGVPVGGTVCVGVGVGVGVPVGGTVGFGVGVPVALCCCSFSLPK